MLMSPNTPMERDLRLPESLLGDQPGGGGRASPTLPESEFAEPMNVEQMIHKLHDRRTREQALHNLSKLKDQLPEVVLLLWHTCGIMFVLLKEITGVYNLISTPNLTQEVSNRVCDTITLFQCIASHLDTRKPFIRAYLPLYLYPFISTESRDKPHEYLRLSSLGAIGALVKSHPPNRDEVDPEIIHFLLESQILCLCILCMEVGTVLSRTVATFIVERILSTDAGLNYCCNFGDRFYDTTRVLRRMTDKLVEEPSRRLLKLIIKCFIELSKGPRDNEGLRCCIPRSLTYPKIINLLSVSPLIQNTGTKVKKLSKLPGPMKGPQDDGDGMRGLQQLLKNVQAHVSSTGDLVLVTSWKAELNS